MMCLAQIRAVGKNEDGSTYTGLWSCSLIEAHEGRHKAYWGHNPGRGLAYEWGGYELDELNAAALELVALFKELE